MSRKYTLLGLIISAALWLSNSANPPDARTGAPGEGLCSDCHGNDPSQQGTIALTGLPASIEPGMQYVLTVTNTKIMGASQSKAGFQVTILNSLNQKAGTYVNNSWSANSDVNSFGGRDYWEHQNAQTYPGNNMVTYTVTWTAPVTPPNTTITAYIVGNIANGNGGQSGDRIVQAQAVGMLNGGANPVQVSITNSVNVLCFGQNTGSATATATQGVTPYSYLWSNGGNTATINNLAAGTYTVTVTDNAGSTASASVTISQPPNLVFTTPSITQVSCNGGNNGSITAGASGGAGPYFFNWSTGGNGNTINNLTAGTYSVTVTDNNDCSKSTSYMVTQPALIVINLNNLEHESCAGEEDGVISISTSGGVPPLFAEWSNGSVGNTIDDLEPGTYSVTVTDNNDCTKTASYTINPGGTVTVELVNITHVTCPGGSNGAVSVMASGGLAPYTYSWSNGGNGPSINNVPAGNYLVTVTDQNGCQSVNFYNVTQPPAFNLNIAQAGNNLCFGNAEVDLTATVAGGSPPYASLWSNGVVGLSNPDLAAGTYTITITDSDGCTATASSVVTQPAQLTVNVVTTDETGVDNNDGTALANAGGGTGAISYLWSNGGTTASITNLPPGTYTVTVTDANGCTATASGQVDEFGCSIDVSLPLDITICNGDTTLIQSQIQGATGVVTYLWSTGGTASEITINTGGEYCVTAQDEAGCQDADCIVVTSIVVGPLVCVVTNESAPGQNDGSIVCQEIPGAVSYLWSNGATTPTITGLAPGQYCLTVTDLNGCTASDCHNVQPGNCNMSITSIVTDVLCAGDSTGSISVTVENATPPVTYAWTNGATTSTISNLPAGVYSVTINDAAGCVENRDYTIAEPAPIDIQIDTVINISVVEGSILITVTGGVAPYSYLWTNPAGANDGNEDQTSLTLEGYYSVRVTDANGCIVTLDSIFVDNEVGLFDEPHFKPLKVYPVPTQDLLYVDMQQDIEDVIISGIDGRTFLRTNNLSQNRIDVSALEAGWYILRISDGERWYIARFVK